MPEVKLLTESELRQYLCLDKKLIDVIDQAFATLAKGEVIMPPVLSMELPMVNGEVDVKTAFIPGLDSFTIKISPGFFNNPQLGLPSLNGLMVTFEANTGLVKAVLLDNGYLTDLRTAAAGGVAARYLAPKNASHAGVIGAGLQAKLQVQALLLERDINHLRVWARNRSQAEAYAKNYSTEFGIKITVSDSIQALLKESQVVITTTPSKQALIQPQWLHPELHITAMGSDSPEKNEIAPEALEQANCLVVDRISQSIERGEMRSAVEAGIDLKPIELGSVCNGENRGRTADNQVTICDLTGTGIQDTAIADYVLNLSQKNSLGTIVTT